MQKTTSILALLLVSSILLSSCNSGSDTVKKAENEVFAVHDEVMPKIGDIMKLKKQLNQRITAIDSLKATGSAATALRSDEERAQAMRLRKDLTVADSLMMGWMSNYNGDTLANLSSDEAMKYLADQKDQINDVKTKVNSSIEQARQFLEGQSKINHKNISSPSGVKLKSFNNVIEVQTSLSMNDIGMMRGWRKDELGWMSSSPYYSFGSESPANGMQNNLAYYLESDDENYIKSLKLVLNVNNSSQEEQAIEKYKDLCKRTFKVLGINAPNGLWEAITKRKEFMDDKAIFSVSNKLDKSKIDTWKMTIETK